MDSLKIVFHFPIEKKWKTFIASPQKIVALRLTIQKLKWKDLGYRKPDIKRQA